MATTNKQLKVFIHGLEDRATKTMTAFLNGPCLNAAEVVNNESADIDIFDYDIISSKRLLNKQLAEGLIRPAIVLSVNNYDHEGTIYIKKPVTIDDMLSALQQAKKIVAQITKITDGLVNPAHLKQAAQSKNSTINNSLHIDNGASSNSEFSYSGDKLQKIYDWFDKDLDTVRTFHH